MNKIEFKPKTLHICIRSEWYKINEKGEIYGGPNKIKEPSGNWLFLGVSTHHWHNHLVYSFKQIWNNPQLAEGGILWDKDHGTTRIWAGLFHGKIPRIQRASIGEL